MRQTQTGQRGLFLVLFSVVAVMLVAMLALLVGSGFLASNRTLLQNASNNVALAAIEGYSSTQSLDFRLRACVGRTRAERVMELNDVKGFNLSGIAINTGPVLPAGLVETAEGRCEERLGGEPSSGRLTYGRWIEDQAGDADFVSGDATKPGNPGCKDQRAAYHYPCFISATKGEVNAAATQVSAVRIDLTTASDTPVFVPFVGKSADVSARSYGVVVPRCFAGVVDLSYSSVSETHPIPASTANPNAWRGGAVQNIAGFGQCPSCGTPTEPALWNACDAQIRLACEVDGEGEPCLGVPCPSRAEVFAERCPNNPGFLNGGWQRPWIPIRNQQRYPVYDPLGAVVEPPFIGIPFIPFDFLVRTNAATSPPLPGLFDHDNCDEPTTGVQFYSSMTWCNMWRGRNPNDPILPHTPKNPPPGYDCADSPQMRGLTGAGGANGAATNKRAHFWSDYDPSNTTGYTNPGNFTNKAWFPKPHQSPYGPLLVDRFVNPPTVNTDGSVTMDSFGPEPLSRYLAAMNAAFRLLAQQSAAGDRALVLGFAGDLMYQEDNPARTNPPALQVAVIPGEGMQNAGGATSDFSLLAQVTNPLGRGAYFWDGKSESYTDGGLAALAEYHPNFIDVGLVSRLVFEGVGAPSRVGHTNILKALLTARSRLLDPANGAGCGPGSLKSIVLFTDGINTCAPIAEFGIDANWPTKLQTGKPSSGATAAQPDLFRCDPGTDTLGRYTEFYARFEDFLFGNGFTAGQDPPIPRGMVELLTRERIAFSAVVDGRSLGAYWNRVLRPNRQAGQSEFLSIAELRAADSAVRRKVFPISSEERASGQQQEDSEAYIGSGSTSFFRKPLDTLGRLAFETGGTLWPILPRCQPADCRECNGSSCYSSENAGAEVKDCAWSGGSTPRLNCSPLNYSESEQAAYVMIESVGQKPFSLREPATDNSR